MIGRVGEREKTMREQCINCVCFHFLSLLSANGSRLIISGVFGFVLCDLHMLPMLGVIGRVVNICIYLLGLCSRATTASVWVYHTRSGQVQDPWMQRITVHLHVSVCSSTPPLHSGGLWKHLHTWIPQASSSCVGPQPLFAGGPFVCLKLDSCVFMVKWISTSSGVLLIKEGKTFSPENGLTLQPHMMSAQK